MNENTRFSFNRIPKPALGLLIIFLGFAVAGAIIIVKNRPSQPPKPESAAIVNGEKIPIEDYETALNQELRFYREAFPPQTGQPVDDIFLEGLPQLILDNLIQEALLTRHLREKGIEITDEDVRAYMQKEVVDAIYGGSWGAYEEFLIKNDSNLEITSRNFKRRLIAEKVAELERITRPQDFDVWYYTNLKSKANIETLVDLSGSPGDSPSQ